MATENFVQHRIFSHGAKSGKTVGNFPTDVCGIYFPYRPLMGFYPAGYGIYSRKPISHTFLANNSPLPTLRFSPYTDLPQYGDSI